MTLHVLGPYDGRVGVRLRATYHSAGHTVGRFFRALRQFELADLFLISGAASTVYGVALLADWAAFITAGGFLLLGGILSARRGVHRPT